MELKHLAPYLPYGLKGILIKDLREEFYSLDVEDMGIFNINSQWELSGYADDDLCIPLGEGEFSGFLWASKHAYACFGNDIKPILRPLSDLTREIEHNGGKFVAAEKIKECAPLGELFGFSIEVDNRDKLVLSTPVTCINQLYIFYFINKLFEWHFDVFGLIEKGEAIDINTL